MTQIHKGMDSKSTLSEERRRGKADCRQGFWTSCVGEKGDFVWEANWGETEEIVMSLGRKTGLTQLFFERTKNEKYFAVPAFVASQRLRELFGIKSPQKSNIPLEKKIEIRKYH